MKGFGNQILQENLLHLIDVKLKWTKVILIRYLVKHIFQNLTGEDMFHAKGKLPHFKNLKLADSNIHNESLSVRILIESDLIWFDWISF